jgi:hypothetical protein
MLLLALLAGPATAADDLTTMNAVSEVWDRYTALSGKDDPAAADVVADSTIRHYAFLRDAARFASAEQVRRLPSADRVTVYGLRARHDDDALATMDGREVYRLCVGGGLCGAMLAHGEHTLPGLSHVTLVSPTLAVGEIAPPDGEQYAYGPSFVFERNGWRVRPEVLTTELSQLIDAQAGTDGPALLQHLAAHYTGEASAPPLLTVLEQPLADDPKARNRLNETWPDYGAYLRTRIEATRVKAESGDPQAQWMYGSLLYAGESPDIVPQDTARGLAMIEAASEAGHTDAAMGAAFALLNTTDRSTLSPDAIRRALPHVRRAATAGEPIAMATYGQLHADGAAGLPRDCVQAEQWLQKAEDAGLAQARNDRVWLLATCAVPGQRDPKAAMQLAAHMIGNRARLHAAELDTVAAVYAANADFTRAIEYQQAALDKLDDATLEPGSRKQMQDRLDLYRSGQDYVETEPSYPVGP